MNIVICNIQMTARSGTEIVTRDLALGLKRRGHDVSVLTPQPAGVLADELRTKGVPVFGDALEVEKPDVIHINHMDSAKELLARFPDVPAIFVCHDATTDHSYASSQAAIKAFFGVSDACRARVAEDTGIPLAQISLLPNYIDLDLIPQRNNRLPLLPRRWLFVAEKYQSDILQAKLEEVATFYRAKLDTVGPWVGKLIEDLPAHFLGYDLVFASARCAIEAAATGAGVIVCDPRGLGGFLTPALWRETGHHNLGLGGFSGPSDISPVKWEVLRWNPWKAAAVSKTIRSERALSSGLNKIESIYHKAIG